MKCHGSFESTGPEQNMMHMHTVGQTMIAAAKLIKVLQAMMWLTGLYLSTNLYVAFFFFFFFF